MTDHAELIERLKALRDHLRETLPAIARFIGETGRLRQLDVLDDAIAALEQRREG